MNPKPKRQKKYQTEKSIIRDIDSAQRRFDRLMKRADELEATVDLLKMSDESTPAIRVEIKDLFEMVDALRSQAKRLKETRMVKLKNTLAAFNTVTLPGIECGSVVLQSK